MNRNFSEFSGYIEQKPDSEMKLPPEFFKYATEKLKTYPDEMIHDALQNLVYQYQVMVGRYTRELSEKDMREINNQLKIGLDRFINQWDAA